MQRRYVTTDVFAERPFAGNQLAVVLDAAGLSTVQMQAVANEFGYSESTFVLPPRDPDHTAHVRIFTPGTELPFAGHPNVGTAFVLATLAARDGDDGHGDGAASFVFEEAAGLVPVRTIREGDSVVGAELTAPGRLTRGAPIPVARVAACLSLSADDVVTTRHEPHVVSVGLGFVVVEVATRDALRRVRPQLDAVHALLPVDGSDAIYAYTRDIPADEGPLDITARMFSMLDGTGEDPATGSATAAIGALFADMDPGADGERSWRVAQGVDMGRPSLLLPRVVERAGQIESVHVGGRCRLMMEGTFDLAGDA